MRSPEMSRSTTNLQRLPTPKLFDENGKAMFEIARDR